MLADVGVGLVARYAVAQELSNGRLRQLLSNWQPHGILRANGFCGMDAANPSTSENQSIVDFLQARLTQ